MSDINETQPRLMKKAVKKPLFWITTAIFILLIFLGVLGGYGSGLMARRSAKATVIAQQVGEQFELSMQAMDAGQYEVALQHFQFVKDNNPNYPGFQEAYAELQRRILASPTPTFTPTPTITPTPDLRSAEEILNNAIARLNSQDWDGTITLLNSLRKVAPNYRAAEVDGMYYIALRNRGISQKIFAENCQDITLEGGIYDLTLAARFGLLDSYADGLRNSARAYIEGASWWDLDWQKAQYYFSQVGIPSMMDSSCLMASERYRYATIQYAEQLIAAGEICASIEQFNLAFQISSQENAAAYPTATAVYLHCNPPTEAVQIPQATSTPSSETAPPSPIVTTTP